MDRPGIATALQTVGVAATLAGAAVMLIVAFGWLTARGSYGAEPGFDFVGLGLGGAAALNGLLLFGFGEVVAALAAIRRNTAELHSIRNNTRPTSPPSPAARPHRAP